MSSIRIILLLVLTPTIFAQCFAPNPRNPKQLNPVACELITETENAINFNTIRSPTSMFSFNLTCIANDTICEKVENALEYAINVVSSYLILNTPIILNASFTSFCGLIPNCSDSDVLGLGSPSRWLLMQDDDDVQRLYPQALVKQFQLKTHLAYDQADILVDFNSDNSYWFEGDPPI
ncbi:429_t:CDS:2, partial [Acaulospora colombiana]